MAMGSRMGNQITGRGMRQVFYCFLIFINYRQTYMSMCNSFSIYGFLHFYMATEQSKRSLKLGKFFVRKKTKNIPEKLFTDLKKKHIVRAIDRKPM